jgi:D-alanine-D-alanine ligase
MRGRLRLFTDFFISPIAFSIVFLRGKYSYTEGIMERKIRVGLVYGGRSGEHEVSLQTALAVIGAFDFRRYEVTPFYITKQGEWRTGAKLLAPVEQISQLQFEKDGASLDAPAGSAVQPLFHGDTDEALDVVFPLLHGTYGEDGTIQGLFEMANIPYVGAGVLASAVGMDKVMMKKMFAQDGLPQCLFRHFTRKQWETQREFYLLEIETALGYPCFVKPANLGSSVGISKAKNRIDLERAVDEAFLYDRKVIVEEFIDAREIEVSVLGNDNPITSVPGEIVSSNEFYDYRAKYIDGKSAMIIPAEIPQKTADEVRRLAILAYQSIEATGLSRVDCFMRKSDGKLFINEVNTMPGFTPYSMYPLLWKETGKSYQELLDELIQLALERHQDKQSLKYSFEV